ncbi:hypothetical protein OIU35_11630 [Boseaceae bacterium BT-24-1]|nr:hypothetical protein [Boseaceae bacterium BT-24-1]
MSVALLGDGDRHGPVADAAYLDWAHWRAIDLAFHDQNRRQSMGATVNASGCGIMAYAG